MSGNSCNFAIKVDYTKTLHRYDEDKETTCEP